MKILASLILLMGTATFAVAAVPVPEIDGGSAAAAVALVSGGLLIIRTRRKK